jgi:hypothetical protein
MPGYPGIFFASFIPEMRLATEELNPFASRLLHVGRQA